MNPNRGPAGARRLSQARRPALLSLAFLVLLLVSLTLYQRLSVPGTPEVAPAASPTSAPRPPAAGSQAQAPIAEPAAQPAAAPSEATLAPARGLARPLQSKYRLLKGFGETDDGFGDLRLFMGAALGAAPGDAVLAVAPGQVTLSQEDPLEGGTVEIDLGAGLLVRYAGLGKRMVREGLSVQTGEIIGQVGEPGPAHRSLGAHLYLQLQENGALVDPIPRLTP